MMQRVSELVIFLKDPSLIPAPMSGRSPMPGVAAAGNPTPSSEPCKHMCVSDIHSQRHIRSSKLT